jgi:curved DNA-binding protein CbpA
VRSRAGHKDYYKILGVTKAATPAEIKKAYRKLAFEHHPDRNPGDPQAAARFIEIAEAYETLADPERRRTYDRTYKPSGSASGSAGAAPPPPRVPAVSTVLQVLEDIWAEIRRRHPEVPPVVIIIASGTASKQRVRGHYSPGRWHASGAEHAEVMISGERLRDAPRDVLATLLHEAAHALAAARGITDTSRQGRYHNKKYALLAAELGLEVAEDTQFGWTITTIPDSTARRYDGQLAVLAAAMILWRVDEHVTRTARRDTNLIAAVCPCGRKIRVAASTLKEAPILCQACDGYFEPQNPADA